MLECHFLLCVCVSVYVSVCVCVFLWSRQYSHHGDQLGILGISVPVDRMILSTAAVSKKSLRTRSNTHTHRQTQTHTPAWSVAPTERHSVAYFPLTYTHSRTSAAVAPMWPLPYRTGPINGLTVSPGVAEINAPGASGDPFPSLRCLTDLRSKL